MAKSMTNKRYKAVIFTMAALLVLLPALCGFLPTALAASTDPVFSTKNACFAKDKPADMNLYIKNNPLKPTEHPTPTITVSSDNYSRVITPVTEFRYGQTRLLLNKSYLASLPNGEYSIRAVYRSSNPNVQGFTISTNFYILQTQTIIFLTQPKTTVVARGDDATFSVSVTGSTGYKYQWQRKSRTGWKNVKGATTSVMTLRKVPDYLTGYTYRCKVASEAGDAFTEEAKVFIIGAGDEENPLLYGLCAALSLGGGVGLTLFKRRKKRPQE